HRDRGSDPRRSGRPGRPGVQASGGDQHRQPALSVSSPQPMRNTVIATAPPVARAGTVDVLVGLLAELDEATESGVFYDRVCRPGCTLTTMTRAALLLHDDAYQAVIPVGSHGLDEELLKVTEGTLDETPIAR